MKKPKCPPDNPSAAVPKVGPSADPTRNALDRRTFLRDVGLGVSWLAAAPSLRVVAGPFGSEDFPDHRVPADKKLSPDWVKALAERGARTWYSGSDLKTIGMPVGGVCAGQVYLGGEGKLVYWDIFNRNQNTGYGAVNYKEGRLPTETVVNPNRFEPALNLAQGFAIRVESGDSASIQSLDTKGFGTVRFCGEYPIATVEYREGTAPLDVVLTAFSPFIPLDSEASTLPATLLRYEVKNTGEDKIRCTLAGWLENKVCPDNGTKFLGNARRVNQRFDRSTATGFSGTVRAEPVRGRVASRPPVVFADFEQGNYGAWTVEGEAFGDVPARGTLASQQSVSGFRGSGLVNTFRGGDDRLHGRLVSPEFVIERPWISFLVGGGGHKGRTCLNLVVDGEIVKTATGRNDERLTAENWSVADWQSRRARLEIIDRESGGWGHINIDQIEFRDEPIGVSLEDLPGLPDYGTMALAVLGETQVRVSAALPKGELPSALFGNGRLAEASDATAAMDQRLIGAVGVPFELEPGASRTLTFAVTWCFPNLFRGTERVGNAYAERFQGASDVAQYLGEHRARLERDTRLWHDTYYDSTLPWWLLDRLHSTVANLATATCQWWENGRFWAWEGCGCCHGTCGHVWNYEHALARLFPDLERSVREMQDFAGGVGFNAETGSIGFRGEGWDLWAGDSQGGYILKAYREHCCSRDDAFLKRNWPEIRKAVEFLIREDGNADGLLEGKQHQTYDQDYYGPNTFVGALYLGALRASERMARLVGETDFANRCREVAESGRQLSMERLFNGEYFIQQVDLSKHPDWQYAEGCLADQLFGQGWAHQVGLGYLYPVEAVRETLRSIWKYCWTPDVASQNEAHPPERWFARPGEGGLLTCTWPKTSHLGPKSTRYRDEVWTGIEYQVAGHMAWEGMVTEALAICRAVHERYHPAKRNPWNEIECGDHYARALASWGVLAGLMGFELDAPAGRVGFAPRITPEDFKGVFTGAEGWGSYTQRRKARGQRSELNLAWGRLPLRELSLTLPDGVEFAEVTAQLGGAALPLTTQQEDRQFQVRFDDRQVVTAGQTLSVVVRW